MNTIDLSCDLGEAESAEQDEIEERIWPLITSANVACGGHAGDVQSMTAAVERAIRFDVALGAHPSYPDRAGFGRRRMKISADALRDSLVEQLTSLRDLAIRSSVTLTHVKPHGALYNDLFLDRELAETVARSILEVDPALALVSSRKAVACEVFREQGGKTVLEGFADRRYESGGSLVPRSQSGSLLIDHEEAASQAVAIATSQNVLGRDGVRVDVDAETICLHADMEGADRRLEAIRRALAAAGVRFQTCHR